MSNGPSKTITLVIASTFGYIYPFIMAALNVALPTIGKEFAAEAVVLGWVATSVILSSAILQVPMGRLADITGRKRIFIIGTIIQIIGGIVCATAQTSLWLIIGRVIQGIGSAMTFSSVMAILTSVCPPEERGKSIGVYMSSVYLGAATGPFIGGLLTQHFGWRSIFFFTAAIASLALLLVFWKLKGEWCEARGEKYDTVGAAAFALSVGALMYGFSMLTTALGLGLVVLGLLGLIAFYRWENRAKSPILNVGLFKKNAVFVFSNVAALINYSAVYAVSFFLSLYLQYIKGMSPQSAGFVLIAQPVLMTLLTPVAGRLADRVDPRLVAGVGMGTSCAGLVILIFLSADSALGLVIAGLVVLGFGFGLFATPNTTAVMTSVEKKFLGVASGMLGTMRSMGMMLSMGIAMMLFSIYIGDVQITPEYYPGFLTSMRLAFIIFASLCAVGTFFQLAGRKLNPTKKVRPVAS